MGSTLQGGSIWSRPAAPRAVMQGACAVLVEQLQEHRLLFPHASIGRGSGAGGRGIHRVGCSGGSPDLSPS